MLEKVSQRSAAHNNLAFIANSSMLSNVKLLYYRLFAYLYGVVGKRSQVCDVSVCVCDVCVGKPQGL